VACSDSHVHAAAAAAGWSLLVRVSGMAACTNEQRPHAPPACEVRPDLYTAHLHCSSSSRYRWNGDPMQRLILLHSNDIHGRVTGLARIATLVAQTRYAHPEIPVLYFDLGDIEDTTNRLSNLTKGVAMHRLLSTAGCNAAVIGNATTIRYGP